MGRVYDEAVCCCSVLFFTGKISASNGTHLAQELTSSKRESKRKSKQNYSTMKEETSYSDYESLIRTALTASHGILFQC